MSHVSTVESFFRRWNTNHQEFCVSFAETMTAEAPWLAALGIPETHGPPEAIALLATFQSGYDLATVRVHMKRIGQTGYVVWTERIDDLTDSKGNIIVSVPVAGVLTLNDDGKLTSYRDYWDMQERQGNATV